MRKSTTDPTGAKTTTKAKATKSATKTPKVAKTTATGKGTRKPRAKKPPETTAIVDAQPATTAPVAVIQPPIEPASLEMTWLHRAPDAADQWVFDPWLEKRGLPSGWKGIVQKRGNLPYGTIMFSNGRFPDRRTDKFGAAPRDPRLPIGVIGTATFTGNHRQFDGHDSTDFLSALRERNGGANILGAWVLSYIESAAEYDPTLIWPAVYRGLDQIIRLYAREAQEVKTALVFVEEPPGTGDKLDPTLTKLGFQFELNENRFLGKNGYVVSKLYLPGVQDSD